MGEKEGPGGGQNNYLGVDQVWLGVGIFRPFECCEPPGEAWRYPGIPVDWQMGNAAALRGLLWHYNPLRSVPSPGSGC